jgi:hypothetical protein
MRKDWGGKAHVRNILKDIKIMRNLWIANVLSKIQT